MPEGTRTTIASSSVCALPWYQWRAPQRGMNQDVSTSVITNPSITGVQFSVAASTG